VGANDLLIKMLQNKDILSLKNNLKTPKSVEEAM